MAPDSGNSLNGGGNVRIAPTVRGILKKDAGSAGHVQIPVNELRPEEPVEKASENPYSTEVLPVSLVTVSLL